MCYILCRVIWLCVACSYHFWGVITQLHVIKKTCNIRVKIFAVNTIQHFSRLYNVSYCWGELLLTASIAKLRHKWLIQLWKYASVHNKQLILSVNRRDGYSSGTDNALMSTAWVPSLHDTLGPNIVDRSWWIKSGLWEPRGFFGGGNPLLKSGKLPPKIKFMFRKSGLQKQHGPNHNNIITQPFTRDPDMNQIPFFSEELNTSILASHCLKNTINHSHKSKRTGNFQITAKHINK